MATEDPAVGGTLNAPTVAATQPEIDDDPELAAMGKVVAALKNLDPAAQQRVIEYAVRRLGLTSPVDNSLQPPRRRPPVDDEPEPVVTRRTEEQDKHEPADDMDGLEGVNVVAQKWIKRSGLSEDQMSALFSLGVDDIDLVANTVPGKNAKERLRSVVLLQGIASYLGTGAPRIDWAKLKQAAGHYDADAGSNWATYMKGLSAEASGSTATGYTLTSRGLNAAKDLIKEIAQSKTK
jgi:hypothetical protein